MIVIAVLLKAVADLVLDYADQAQEIGESTTPPGASPRQWGAD